MKNELTVTLYAKPISPEKRGAIDPQFSSEIVKRMRTEIDRKIMASISYLPSMAEQVEISQRRMADVFRLAAVFDMDPIDFGGQFVRWWQSTGNSWDACVLGVRLGLWKPKREEASA